MTTDDITYVDADPLIPGHLPAGHVHHRGSDRCLRNDGGAACPSPAESRARVRELEAEVERLREIEAAVTEMAPADEVIVEGSWFPRADLPRILGNFMRGEQEAWSQVKSEHIKREAAEARLDAVRALAAPFSDGSMPIVEAVTGMHDLTRAAAHAVVSEVLRHVASALDSDATASEPTVERITDGNGDEMERGADTDAEAADQPQPTSEADEPTYEIAAQFQDGEVFTPEQMARGLGVFDEEAPVLVARKVGDDEWLTLGSGGGFIAEYDVWDYDDEPEPARQQGEDRTDTPGGQR